MNRSQAAVKKQTTQRPTSEAVLGSSRNDRLGLSTCCNYVMSLTTILPDAPGAQREHSISIEVKF